MHLAHAYRNTGRNEKAAKEYRKVIQIQPDNIFAHLGLAASYIHLGLDEDAHTEAAEVLRINPKFSVEQFAKNSGIKDSASKEVYIRALLKAGLPE